MFDPIPGTPETPARMAKVTHGQSGHVCGITALRHWKENAASRLKCGVVRQATLVPDGDLGYQ